MRGDRWGVVPALPLLAVLLGGCVPTVERPEVWLAGARVASLGLSGGVVEVRLSIYNPNRFEVEASNLTYDLDFEDPDGEDDWIDFTDGELGRGVEVPAGDTAEVLVPVEFSYRGLGDLARGLIDRGAFNYRVSGVVTLQRPMRRDLQFRHEGRVTPGGVR